VIWGCREAKKFPHRKNLSDSRTAAGGLIGGTASFKKGEGGKIETRGKRGKFISKGEGVAGG